MELEKEQPSKKHHHYVLPFKTVLMVGGVLLFLTFITVFAAQFDFGSWNFPVAMFIATVKGLFVVLIFMNLMREPKLNKVIFGTAFVFVFIFFILLAPDVFYRSKMDYSQLPGAVTRAGLPKFKKPWVRTDEILSHGKTVFAAQCVSCHGDGGHGDGPAAGASTTLPRDFSKNVGWKNGRKLTGVYKTLRDGIAGTSMASFESLASEDRWALSHYVLSLGTGKAPAPTMADFARIGVNPRKNASVDKVKASIPVPLALERMLRERGRR